MAPAFVWFKEARMADRDSFAGLVRDLAHAPRRTRHWVEEHVYLGEDSAVFIGESLEQQPAEDGGKPLTRDGWSTVVWVRDHGAWKVAHYQWQKGGIDVERDVWNDQFRTGAGFNHKPNQLLVDAVKGRTPGRALDLASGQGRNALYLATQGWTVTAVDISDVGLKITGDSAAAANVKIETVEADTDDYDLGTDRWDLVAMIYAGADDPLVKRAQVALKKGGLFVTEYFATDSDTAKMGAGGWDKAALAAEFKGFKIVRDDEVLDLPDYGKEKDKVVRFVAEKQ
jgi:SAM-dependent methyltransferase